MKDVLDSWMRTKKASWMQNVKLKKFVELLSLLFLAFNKIAAGKQFTVTESCVECWETYYIASV